MQLADPRAAVELLAQPWRWPDIASAGGRFTPVCTGGLLGQTFEIEVVAEPAPRAPIFTRGYVTCTTLHVAAQSTAESNALSDAVAQLERDYRTGAGPDAEPMLPPESEPIALVVLTTHRGHFLGAARSHLLVWSQGARAWIRDIGAWDPLPAHLAAAYRAAGRTAQREFWGPTPPERSMLAQLALRTAPTEPGLSG